MKIKDFRGGEGETFRGFAAHSRRIVVSCAKHSFTPDTPSFGSFAAQKHHTVMFLLAHPCRYSRSYKFKYPIQAKNKTTRLGGFTFWRRRRDYLGTQAFRCTVGVSASHRAKGILLVFCDACHSLALPYPRTASGRARPSRAAPSLLRTQISPTNEKRTPFGVLFVGGEGEI